MGAVVGIDLGTTNTVVAAAREGRPTALPDESGSTLIPSIVSFLPSGAVLVGNAAKARRSVDARNTIYSIKRLIGRTWGTPEINEAVARFPFELREGPGRATFVIARGETYTLPEISAFVLRKAKSIAELELGEPVNRAVITVPANFNDLQRAATKVAGRVAGLEVLRVLNEPTAAALAFGHARGNRECIAVYDFGGGTFDLTILRLTDDVFEVLATSGDTYLGGDDIDAAIVQKIASRLSPAVVVDPRAQPDVFERLRSAAEQVKLDLSDAPDARVRLTDYEMAESTGLEFAMTRNELDALVDPIVERTFSVCRDALGTAKLAPKDINHVLLVGGTTRVPLVKQRVEEFFGRSVHVKLDPHEVVALGAAQQAMALTQLRATASGVPVAPPPRLPLQSNPSEDASGTEQQHAESFGLQHKKTDSGIGDRDTIPPARVSVPPPEEPMPLPAPTTQPLGSHDRRITGIGPGPSAEPTTSAAGRGAATEMSHGSAAEPEHPLIAVPALRSSGVAQPTEEPAFDAAAAQPNRDDADMPAVARRGVARDPTIRFTRGSTALPDTSATITSAVVRPNAPGAATSAPLKDPLLGPLGHPGQPLAQGRPTAQGAPPPTAASKSARETIPDSVEPWDELAIGSAISHDLPVVATKPRPPLGRAPTQVNAAVNQPQMARTATMTTSSDPAVDLPLVAVSRTDARGRHPPSAKAQEAAYKASSPTALEPVRHKLERPQEPRLGLPEPNATSHASDHRAESDDELNENEPTVIRRSTQGAPGLGSSLAADAAIPKRQSQDGPTREAPPESREQIDLPIVASPQLGSTSTVPLPSQRSNNPAKLNEAEIRARYGNLPLIVGGKRVGTREPEAQALSVVGSELRPPFPSAQPVAKKTASATPPGPNLSVPTPAATQMPPEPPRESVLRTVESQLKSAAGATAQTKQSPTLEQSTAEEVTVTKHLQAPPLTEKSTPFGRQLQPTPVFSFDPHAIEPDEIEPDEIESLASEPTRSRISVEPLPTGLVTVDEAVPKSHHLLSSRPSARQNIAELELPIPDLPPRQPTFGGGPTAKGTAAPSADPLFNNAQGHPTAAHAAARRPAEFAPVGFEQPAFVSPPQQIGNLASGPRGRVLNRGPNSPLEATLPLGVAATSPSTRQPPAAARTATSPIVLPGAAPLGVNVPPLLASLPKSNSLRPALLIDVTPLSLCVETVGGYVDVLVNRNTPVPCERTRDFVTVHDNQQTVIVRVAQGESKLFHENALLGEVQLTGIPAGLRGQSRIAVTFAIDSDGILHVRALDVTSGLSAIADLRLAGAPTPPEIAQMTVRQASKGHA